jgi:hypothetical protein
VPRVVLVVAWAVGDVNIFGEAIKVQAHLSLKMLYDALGTRGMWNGVLILLIPQGSCHS